MYKVKIVGVTEPDFGFDGLYDMEKFNKIIIEQGYVTETSYVREVDGCLEADEEETEE